MKVVLQRVSKASVSVGGKIISQIDQGLLILLGITPDDTHDDISWLCHKIAHLRIFNDDNQIMNKSLIDVQGNAIVVSQFTLMASTKKGHRPSYIQAAKPDLAIPLYQAFIQTFEEKINTKVGTGEFGADMKVELINDGPVTILIDSKRKE